MRIAILAFPGFQTLDVVGPFDVFAEANRQLGRPFYQIELVSTGTGPVLSSAGLGLTPHRTTRDPIAEVDTLLVAGSPDLDQLAVSTADIEWVRDTARTARRYGSICTGAFVLAEAGLLADRRVTTHWSKADKLAELYPKLALEPDSIFICDGPVCSSAGVTAGIDLALALVEADCGRAAALAVARELVIYLKRAGGQSQFSTFLAGQIASVPAIEAVQKYIEENLTADLSVGALARRAGMSPRNFSRVFLKETGVTPGDYVESARTDAARRLIADKSMPLQRVAARAGFVSISNLRRAFARRLMTTPTTYRDNFGQQHPKVGEDA